MSTAEQIRNTIIDELMSINDPDQLTSLKEIVSAKSNPVVQVTNQQKQILSRSDQDIAAGNLHTNEEVEKDDQEWL